MRLFLPGLMGIATLLWIVGGTFWCKNHFHEAPELIKNAPTIAVRDGISFNVNATPFFFTLAQTRPIFVSESIPILKKTADYLHQNIDKSLIIKGLYSPKEKTLQPTTDLGILRAEAIKSVLIDLGVHDESIDVASEESSNVHFVNNQLTDGIEMRFVNNSKTRFQPLNIYFLKNKFRFVESDELLIYFNNLNRFLNLNPNIWVKISAPASNTEGVRYARKRLAYMESFLRKKQFNLSNVLFKNDQTNSTTIQTEHTQKHRIEIRLVSQ